MAEILKPAVLSREQLCVIAKITKSFESSSLIPDKPSPPHKRVERLVAWKNDPVQQKKAFLVKWKNLSDIHCNWNTIESLRGKGTFSEADIQKVPLLVDEGDLCSTLRFQIERIICHFDPEVKGNPPSPSTPDLKRRLYLIKWEDSEYTRCSWETEEEILKYGVSKEASMQAFKNYAQRLQNDYVNPRYQLNTRLRDCQYEDVQWLSNRCLLNYNSILTYCAGPNLQVIATVTILMIAQTHPTVYSDDFKTLDSERHHGKTRFLHPFLILTEESRVMDWMNLLNSTTNLYSVVYHGSETSREIIRAFEWRSNSMDKNKRFPRCDVLIVSKGVIEKDYERLKPIYFEGLVIDAVPDLYRVAKFRDIVAAFKTKRTVFLFTRPLDGNVQQLSILLQFIDPIKLIDLRSQYGDSLSKWKLLTAIKEYVREVAEPAFTSKAQGFTSVQNNAVAGGVVHGVQHHQPSQRTIRKTITQQPRPQYATIDLKTKLSVMGPRKRQERIRQILLEKIVDANKVDDESAKLVGMIGLMARAILEMSH